MVSCLLLLLLQLRFWVYVLPACLLPIPRTPFSVVVLSLQIAAARAMGADFAYLGTRFIATAESAAQVSDRHEGETPRPVPNSLPSPSSPCCPLQDTYKKMLTETSAEDVMYTAAISGVPANFLRPSLVQAGLDPDNLSCVGAAGAVTGDVCAAESFSYHSRCSVF